MGTLEKFAYRQSCIITHFEFSSPTFAEVKIWFQLDDSNCSSERERRTEVVRKFKDFIILNVFFYLVREDDSNCTSHYLKTKDKLAKKPPWLTRLFLKNCLKTKRHSNHAMLLQIVSKPLTIFQNWRGVGKEEWSFIAFIVSAVTASYALLVSFQDISWGNSLAYEIEHLKYYIT